MELLVIVTVQIVQTLYIFTIYFSRVHNHLPAKPKNFYPTPMSK